MLYELHLTASRADEVGHWMNTCGDLHIKPLLIELEGGGFHPKQMMMAAVHEGNDRSMHAWWKGIKSGLELAGFQISRTKIEVPLDKSVPYDAPAYHEAHIKSLIDQRDVLQVVMFARAHGWVASRNALFKSDDGLEKWYFTQRAYDVDYKTAGSQFRKAFGALPDFSWHTVRMEMETVIQDDNEGLDAGWAI